MKGPASAHGGLEATRGGGDGNGGGGILGKVKDTLS